MRLGSSACVNTQPGLVPSTVRDLGHARCVPAGEPLQAFGLPQAGCETSLACCRHIRGRQPTTRVAAEGGSRLHARGWQKYPPVTNGTRMGQEYLHDAQSHTQHDKKGCRAKHPSLFTGASKWASSGCRSVHPQPRHPPTSDSLGETRRNSWTRWECECAYKLPIVCGVLGCLTISHSERTNKIVKRSALCSLPQLA